LFSHDRVRKTALWLGCVELLCLLIAVAPQRTVAQQPSPKADNDETLLLEVHINGQTTGKIGEFTLRNNKLLVKPDELKDLGVRVPSTIALQNGGLIAFSDLPMLKWNLDQKNQILEIVTGDTHLQRKVILPNGGDASSGPRTVVSGTGVTLNYDMIGTFANGSNSGAGSIDARFFSPKGIFSSDWITYIGADSNNNPNSAIRLDTAYSYEDVNTLLSYTLGDYITSGLSWTRPVRLEGAQISLDYRTRPDLVTFPLPTINGSAAVPSTIQVLTNGNVIASSQIGSGPFEIPQLPVITGAGNISMTITNALGQQVTVNQPFYANSSLLAPGLKTFSVEAGMARLNYGTQNFDYGKIAGNVIYRRGITTKFTIEGSLEGTPGTFKGGAGGLWQIGNLGVINFSAAGSTWGGQTGTQLSAGAQRIGRVFSVGASATFATGNYRDVAALNGDAVANKQINGFISAYYKRLGTVGVGYSGTDQNAVPATSQQSAIPASQSHVFTANYSVQIHHMSFFASEFRDVGSNGSSGFQVGVTIPFSRRSSVNVVATSDGSAQVQVQQSAAEIGQWGYQAFASGGNSNHEFGQLQYKSPVGLFTAGVDYNAGVTTVRAESQGAFSFIDKALFPSNTIYDSFAIVDTAPMHHVRVLQENREVGRTDSSGRLLVPDMRSFDLNHIAIEPVDIPPDATIDVATHQFRPQDLSGVVVKFPVKVSHGALLKLVDEKGEPIPLGSTGKLRTTDVAVPVGYDGNAYVVDLDRSNTLDIVLPDARRCSVTFDYKPQAGDIPLIGPLTCKEKQP
jgi:outer membrane usher protein